METLNIKKGSLYFVDGTSLHIENAEFSQKGTVMVFTFPDGRVSVVNWDNVLRITYEE